MVRLPTTTNTTMATTASPVDRPSWASPAAAPAVRMRFFGLTPASTTPSPKALAGETDSIVESHVGIWGASPAPGRLRQLRRARRSRSTPRTILPHDTESDAVLLVATSPSCART